MEGIYAWIKSIVIFMIFLTIISNLIGKSDFKKYINVVTGLLLVLITVSPILKLLVKKGDFNLNLKSITFQLKTTEIANEMKDAEESQYKVILQQYKKEITGQVKDLLQKEELYLTSCDVVIDEDVNSENFAQIKTLAVIASYYVKDKEGSSLVDKVQIDKIEISSESSKIEKKQQKEYLTPMEIHIKTVLSDFYNMDADNINISIQGG